MPSNIPYRLLELLTIGGRLTGDRNHEKDGTMKRAVIFFLFLAVVLARPVFAQTSTTSSTTSTTSSSTTSSTTTSTTVSSTTTTTAPVVTADADPPAAFLSGTSGEVGGELGSFCWAPPGGTAGRCVDKISLPVGPALTVRRGENLSLRFATGLSLTELEVRADGAALAAPMANLSRFQADLAPGTYQLLVFPRFSAGSASYGFRLVVTAPAATPTVARPLALTG